MTINLKPADELLTIRNRIKELKAREAEIKDGMQAGDLDTAGEFAIATITTRKTKRFDRKSAEAELGDLSRFDVEGAASVLTVEELVGELVE